METGALNSTEPRIQKRAVLKVGFPPTKSSYTPVREALIEEGRP